MVQLVIIRLQLHQDPLDDTGIGDEVHDVQQPDAVNGGVTRRRIPVIVGYAILLALEIPCAELGYQRATPVFEVVPPVPTLHCQGGCRIGGRRRVADEPGIRDDDDIVRRSARMRDRRARGVAQRAVVTDYVPHALRMLRPGTHGHQVSPEVAAGGDGQPLVEAPDGSRVETPHVGRPDGRAGDLAIREHEVVEPVGDYHVHDPRKQIGSSQIVFIFEVPGAVVSFQQRDGLVNHPTPHGHLVEEGVGELVLWVPYLA